MREILPTDKVDVHLIETTKGKMTEGLGPGINNTSQYLFFFSLLVGSS